MSRVCPCPVLHWRLPDTTMLRCLSASTVPDRAVLVGQEVITINVQPGWKDGTRITYAGLGDELPGQPAQVGCHTSRSKAF